MSFLIYPTLILATAGFAILLVAMLLSLLRLSMRAKSSLFHLTTYIVVFVAACLTIFSDRSLSTEFTGTILFQVTERNPALRILIPLTSAAILFLSIDQIVKFFRREGHLYGPQAKLTLLFLLYWFLSVASPMLLSAHPYFQHYYIYPMIIGFGALMMSDDERDNFVATTRNALLAFIALGYLLLLVKPDMAADFSYSQGLIPGMPRFAGLSPHSTVIAGLTQITMLVLLLKPYLKKHHNTLAWLLCGVTFVFAQSKTVWISSIFIGVILYVIRNKESLRAKLWDERKNGFFIAAIMLTMFFATFITGNLMFGNTSNKLSNFLNSQEGAQLTSMTGRDQIWELAIARWHSNPIFGEGAGPPLEMSSAVHAHNQLLDTLMHAGLVGGTGLVLYFLALAYYSFKYSADSRGVTLAIFLVIAFRSIGEIPLTIKGYGLEFIAQLLLLVLIASYAGRRTTHPTSNHLVISSRYPCQRSQ